MGSQVATQNALVADQVALSDLWDAGLARFEIDEASGLLGADFYMHFIAPARTSLTLAGDELLNTYYIHYTSSPTSIWTTGLATSEDGVEFTDLGQVLGVGAPGAFDDRIASFASVWRDQDTWYMVYEGAGFSSNWPGDIGLAVSSDGVHWTKDAAPILNHRDGGSWERHNIGTPSLYKYNGTWYLFYHGYDGTDVRVGLATGADLRRLTRANNGNPVLWTSANGWDSGTIGWRSIVQEGDYFYMVYEGSTDASPSFATARWSSGLARSSDLIHWEKYAGNPVLPQTASGFGYDGPQWARTQDGALHIYFRYPERPTQRATLMEYSPPVETDLLLQAETDLRHQIGRAEADGWSADTARDRYGFLAYGPYTDAVAAGANTATFRLMVDNNTHDNWRVVTLDVYDATVGRVLAQRDVLRTEFGATYAYQDFALDFDAPGQGHQLEFRTLWHRTSYVRQDWVRVVSATPAPPGGGPPPDPEPQPDPDPQPDPPPDPSPPVGTDLFFEAETDLSHQIGRAEADGWSVHTALDRNGFLAYGPYTDAVTAGANTATFRLMVDNNTHDNWRVVTLDVYDATAGRVLAQRDVFRKEFGAIFTYQDFALDFNAPGQGHRLEFRTLWHRTSYVRQDSVQVVSATPAPPSVNPPTDPPPPPDPAPQPDPEPQPVPPPDAPPPVETDLLFEAETDLSHQIGRAEADGWSADTALDREGFLSYGPYTDAAPAGANTATFRLMVDNNTHDNSVVVTLDVYDATAGRILARRHVYRREFNATFAYQDFVLNFNSPGQDHELEFRTYWRRTSYVRQDWVLSRPS